MFDKYSVKITLLREMLGTNPLDPNILDQHIIERQRKLILENCKINKEVNKYLDQLPITQERGKEEVDKLFERLERLGVTLNEEDRERILKGDLEKIKETTSELNFKGTTVFYVDKDTALPCIGDHMIYGFLKAAGEAISKTLPKKPGKMLHSSSYTSSIINKHVACDKPFLIFDRDIKLNEDGSPFYLQRSLRAETAKGPRISLAKSEVVEEGATLNFILKVLKDSPLTEDVLRKLFEYGELKGLGQWRNSGKGTFKYELNKI